MIKYYIDIFNNLNSECIENIISENKDNIGQHDFVELYFDFLKNVDYLEISETISETISDINTRLIISALIRYNIVNFDFEYYIMKVFIIHYLFYIVKTKMDVFNLLKLYTSVFKCIEKAYALEIVDSLTKKDIEKTKTILSSELNMEEINELNIYYNVSRNMIGGAHLLAMSKIIGTGIATIATIFAVTKYQQDINLQTIYGDTSLMVSVRQNNINKLLLLFKQGGVDMNSQNVNGDTALMLATSNNNIEIVELLLKQDGLDMYLQNKSGNTALMTAVDDNNIKMVELFLYYLDDLDMNLQNKEGNNALILATGNTNISMVKLLLKQDGLDMNLQNEYGNTALIRAIQKENISMVKLLLTQDGVDMNLQNEYGNTALIRAVFKENIEMVELLLKRGGLDINLQTIDGNTALMLAKKKKIL